MLVRTGLPTATALLLATTTSAFALDAQTFADRLQTVAADQGLEIAYESAEADGQDVTLQGFAIENGDAPGEARDVTFEGVSGSATDGYTVERIPYPDIERTRDRGRLTVSGIIVEGLTIAGTDGASGSSTGGGGDRIAGATPLFFDRAAVNTLSVDQADETIFTLSNAEVQNETGDDEGYSTQLRVGAFESDFTAGEEREIARTMRAIGYPTLSGAMTGSGSWEPDSGSLQLSDLTFDVENAGDLTLDYAISGYTPAFIQSLSELQARMEEDPQSQRASGMALMGLVSQLSLDRATIAFDDQSLTEKLLDYYAERNGQSRDALIQNLVGMMPAALSYIQDPEFRNGVAEAIETYLDDPRSLRVAIEPENPIPATQIIGAAMGAPRSLPGILALSVNANGEVDASAGGGAASGDGGDATDSGGDQ